MNAMNNLHYYYEGLVEVRDTNDIRIKHYLINTLLMSNQFVYLQDVRTKTFHEKGITDVLRHDVSHLTPDFFIKNIHPMDLDMYFKTSKAYRKFLCENVKDIKPFKDSFETNFRIRNKEGDYVPVLRHITPFIVNEENKVEVFLSICTDISFLGTSNSVKFKVFSESDTSVFSTYLTEEKLFSGRETEVLKLLVRGYSSSRIANVLFVSVNTVNTHRKNLMKKANVNKTIDLVTFALENGYSN